MLQVRLALDKTISVYMSVRGTDLTRRQSTVSGCQNRMASGKAPSVRPNSVGVSKTLALYSEFTIYVLFIRVTINIRVHTEKVWILRASSIESFKLEIIIEISQAGESWIIPKFTHARYFLSSENFFLKTAREINY